MAVLDEDALYRQSSQFKHWSFAPQQLETLRRDAVASASGRVRAAAAKANLEIEPLDVEDEVLLLNAHLIWTLVETVKIYFMQMPNADRIRATAAQYMRRHYLLQSLMDPIPGIVLDKLEVGTLLTFVCIYLAMKVHDEYIDLGDYCKRIRDKGEREGLVGGAEVTEDTMRRAEAAVTRGLRFCFHVRHAAAGLRGLELDLKLTLLTGGSPALRQELSAGAAGTDASSVDAFLRERIAAALNGAAGMLKYAAHASDAYFLYSPSQILFAAVLLGDEELAAAYLRSKVTDAGGDADVVLAVVQKCATLVRQGLDLGTDRQQRVPHLEKLRQRAAQCTLAMRGPVIVAKYQGSSDDDHERESDTPRKRVKRENGKQKDDVFGSYLGSVTAERTGASNGNNS